MTYATHDDVINRFKPIKTMIGTGSSDVTTAELNSVYIADAESYVDGYLAVRYTVPINPVSPIITQLTSDLAIFNMFAEKSGNIPEWMDKRYERCIKTLEMLRDGDMMLNSASVLSSGDNFAWSSTQGYHNIFSPVLDELDQIADQDRVNADQNERSDDFGVNTP